MKFILLCLLLFNGITAQMDTERFQNYMARIMSDEAWKYVLNDIESLKLQCKRYKYINFNYTYINIDMADYVSANRTTFKILVRYLHLHPHPSRYFNFSLCAQYFSKYIWCANFPDT